MLRVLLVSVLLLAVATLAQDGFDLGRWTFTTFDLGEKAAPLPKLGSYHARVYAPLTCESQCGEFRSGGMPVMLFATGFAAQVDAKAYDTILTGIARHGIVVVAVDQDLGFTLTLDYGKLGADLNNVVTYIQNQGADGLLEDLRANGFTNSLLQEGSRIIFAGHSSGAHLILRNIQDYGLSTETCSYVGGVVMLSPMDGQDPLGFGGQFIVEDSVPLPINTPGLLISAELDSASGLIEGISCTPDDRGNVHFYDAWQGSISLIDARDVGTLDLLDEDASTTYDDFCASSNASQVETRVSYRTMVRGSIVSFIQGTVTGDNSYITKLDNSRDLDYPVISAEVRGSFTFACIWDPQDPGVSYEQELGYVFFGICFAGVFLCGLYCYFRGYDEDTLHRYQPTEGIGYDPKASFQTRLETEDKGRAASVAV